MTLCLVLWSSNRFCVAGTSFWHSFVDEYFLAAPLGSLWLPPVLDPTVLFDISNSSSCVQRYHPGRYCWCLQISPLLSGRAQRPAE